jgi:MOSC domain-containing protein YiiM
MHKDLTPGKLLSINISLPVTVPYGSKEVSTGIFKQPIAGPAAVTRHGLQGDGQADLVNHGGPDKAVCVYSFAHRPFWEAEWGKPMDYAAFGENFTVTELREKEVCIGDVLRAGSALFQVSQARLPCFKLALKHELPKLPEQVQQTGYTGFYLRVLEEGEVQAGDELVLVGRHPEAQRMTVFDAARIMLFGKHDLAASERLLAIPGLASSWQEMLTERIGKLKNP